MSKPNICCFATLKGGAGKTMNVFNVAGILAEKNNVLVVDVDPQCNLSLDCGIDIATTGTYSVKEIYEKLPKEQPHPSKVVVKNTIKELPKLDVIPSSIFLFQTEKEMSVRGDRERILEKYFKKHSDFFSQYKYILFDTNPSMSYVNINALLLADNIILSCDVSNNSVTGAELFCSLWDSTREDLGEEKDNVTAMLISNYDGRSALAKDLISYSKEQAFSKDIVLKNFISSTVRLKETEINHKPINILYPKHNACEQYRAVVQELKKREVL